MKDAFKEQEKLFSHVTLVSFRQDTVKCEHSMSEKSVQEDMSVCMNAEINQLNNKRTNNFTDF